MIETFGAARRIVAGGVVLVMLVCLSAQGTSAQPVRGEVELPPTTVGAQTTWAVDVLNGEADAEEDGRLSERFKAQAPPARVRVLSRVLRDEHGWFEPVRVEEQSGEGIVLLLRGEQSGGYVRLIVGIDGDGLISTLLVQAAPDAGEPMFRSWREVEERLSGFDGRASLGVYRVVEDAGGGLTIAPHRAFNDDERLAIGSTFKLYVLGALGEMVLAGEASWDEKLAIRDEWKSLPSGLMQDEPEGAEFTLEHFAQEMIRISDNTATDHLIHRVGRERIESYMSRLHGEPGLNKPFLTTREMFAIKLQPERDLAQRFAAADERERRKMVAPGGEVAEATPHVLLAAAWRVPVEIGGVEWFASARECALAMADLERLGRKEGMGALRRALRRNPGIRLESRAWTDGAFKGGSEPGVMNLTWLLERTDGERFAVSIGFNNEERALDEGECVAIAAGVLRLLGDER